MSLASTWRRTIAACPTLLDGVFAGAVATEETFGVYSPPSRSTLACLEALGKTLERRFPGDPKPTIPGLRAYLRGASPALLLAHDALDSLCALQGMHSLRIGYSRGAAPYAHSSPLVVELARSLRSWEEGEVSAGDFQQAFQSFEENPLARPLIHLALTAEETSELHCELLVEEAAS